ncbi:ribonuclease H-like domain-containing protein [Rhizophagus clarus]|uniref:Ribonuclease H-like domain-containing protein n=1 Tax=Rhizophagus clarus TaxID=94130 RepID=A0A8H3L1S9_9GLOM|nr:ribonuclease H-like domain-containing protein [Rhizophagus clarus]
MSTPEDQDFDFSIPSPALTPITPGSPAPKEKKKGGQPKSLVWGTHVIQGRKVSEDHYEATCSYCSYFWKKGSSQDLEGHFANVCPKVPDKFNESTKLSEDRVHEIDRTCVKAFVVCGIPWNVIENLFFIELLKTLRPGYTPPSKDVLSGKLLSQETAVINQRVIKELKNAENLTMSCDGWTNSANESIWNFLIHTSDHEEYLWCLKDLSSESHTGEFLAKTIEEIIEKIGPEKFSALITDSGANI